MIRRHGNALRALLMMADGVLALAMGLLVYSSFAKPDATFAGVLDTYWVRAVAYAVLWVGLLYLSGAYRLRAHWTLLGEAKAIGRATLWLAVAGLAALFLFQADVVDRGYVLLLFPLQGLAAIAIRSTLRFVFMYFRERGHNTRNLLILGTDSSATAFATTVREHSVLGVTVVGYLGAEPPSGEPSDLYRGQIPDLLRILREEVIDEVAVCVAPNQWQGVQGYVQLAHDEGKIIRVPLATPHMQSSRRFLEDLGHTALLSYTAGPDELTEHAFKRVFDLIVASTTLLLLSPLIIAIAIILRVRQGPHVIFKQTRVGRHGRPFTIYKFRSMSLDAEDRYAELASMSTTSGAAFKMATDPRVTRLGRILRRYSLDELPQFFNVLRGDMSIVGPRPAPRREVDAYDLWHRRRLSMKPGITGLWQISSRLDRTFDDRAELDLVYIDRWSMWLDLTIMFRTLPAIIRKPGV